VRRVLLSETPRRAFYLTSESGTSTCTHNDDCAHRSEKGLRAHVSPLSDPSLKQRLLLDRLTTRSNPLETRAIGLTSRFLGKYLPRYPAVLFPSPIKRWAAIWTDRADSRPVEGRWGFVVSSSRPRRSPVFAQCGKAYISRPSSKSTPAAAKNAAPLKATCPRRASIARTSGKRIRA
jgi:hypothetical protein